MEIIQLSENRIQKGNSTFTIHFPKRACILIFSFVYDLLHYLCVQMGGDSVDRLLCVLRRRHTDQECVLHAFAVR